MAIASSFSQQLGTSWTWKTSYQAIAILLKSATWPGTQVILSQKDFEDSWGKKQKSYCGNRSENQRRWEGQLAGIAEGIVASGTERRKGSSTSRLRRSKKQPEFEW